jgi:hypothetical protein
MPDRHWGKSSALDLERIFGHRSSPRTLAARRPPTFWPPDRQVLAVASGAPQPVSERRSAPHGRSPIPQMGGYVVIPCLDSGLRKERIRAFGTTGRAAPPRAYVPGGTLGTGP